MKSLSTLDAKVENREEMKGKMEKEKGEESYRTATTSYPCCISALGEFEGSWSYDPHGRKINFIFGKKPFGVVFFYPKAFLLPPE